MAIPMFGNVAWMHSHFDVMCNTKRSAKSAKASPEDAHFAYAYSFASPEAWKHRAASSYHGHSTLTVPSCVIAHLMRYLLLDAQSNSWIRPHLTLFVL